LRKQVFGKSHVLDVFQKVYDTIHKTKFNLIQLMFAKV